MTRLRILAMAAAALLMLAPDAMARGGGAVTQWRARSGGWRDGWWQFWRGNGRENWRGCWCDPRRRAKDCGSQWDEFRNSISHAI